MEAYQTGDAACRAGVLAFMSAWTAQLHDLGYLSGFYSSMGSGVADQVANYAAPGYVRPDYLDFARWDNVATLTDPAIPAELLDAAPPDEAVPRRPQGDLGRRHDQHRQQPWSTSPRCRPPNWPTTPATAGPDVLARTASTGNLFIYPGNGTYVEDRTAGRSAAAGSP